MTAHHDVEVLAAKLSRAVRIVITEGDDGEWYASSERIADQIVDAGIAWRPFTYDRLVLVPNHIGRALRSHLIGTGNG